MSWLKFRIILLATFIFSGNWQSLAGEKYKRIKVNRSYSRDKCRNIVSSYQVFIQLDHADTLVWNVNGHTDTLELKSEQPEYPTCKVVRIYSSGITDTSVVTDSVSTSTRALVVYSVSFMADKNRSKTIRLCFKRGHQKIRLKLIKGYDCLFLTNIGYTSDDGYKPYLLGYTKGRYYKQCEPMLL